MSEVANTVEAEFRGMLKEQRFRSITVTDLCDRAGISRNTFYKYFDGKTGIVDKALRRDVVDPAATLNEMLTFSELCALGPVVYERLCTGIRNDGDYYRSLVMSMMSDDGLFVHVLSHALYDLNLAMLHKAGHRGSNRERDYIAHCLATSQAVMLQRWIIEEFDPSPDELAGLYGKIALPYWNSLRRGGL